ncbi:CAF17-like 4Fe-4S cluster assembly/insertion protein YgfZ [Thermaurantiacus sp.]
MPLAHLRDRRVLRISGADARPFLQALVTHDVGLLAAGQPLATGLLSPQGKALYCFLLHAEGDDILLDCDAEVAGALAKRLLMFRLRRAVEITPTGLAVFAAWGDSAPDRPADPRLAALGRRWVAPADAHAPDASLADWHAHRIALGVPDQAEIGTDELLWLETNARELNAVSFTKGCYVGQENTARMHHRDKVRKRLLPLKLAGPQGDGRVMAGDREAGMLRGSGAGDLRFALLRTELLDQPLTIAGAPATLVRPKWLA